MRNTLQGMLLEEMENFHGILLATTNMPRTSTRPSSGVSSARSASRRPTNPCAAASIGH